MAINLIPDRREMRVQPGQHAVAFLPQNIIQFAMLISNVRYQWRLGLEGFVTYLALETPPLGELHPLHLPFQLNPEVNNDMGVQRL